MQNILNNQIDLEGLWEIIVEPPEASDYKLGQIVEITDILPSGYDYWNARTWFDEPVVMFASTNDDMYNWTRLSKLRKIYEI